jgi:hypothetical protein
VEEATEALAANFPTNWKSRQDAPRAFLGTILPLEARNAQGAYAGRDGCRK